MKVKACCRKLVKNLKRFLIKIDKYLYGKMYLSRNNFAVCNEHLKSSLPENSKIHKNSVIKKYFGNQVKIKLVREDKPEKDYWIEDPFDTYELVKKELLSSDREVFLVISLDAQCKVLGVNEASIGDLDSTLVHPREIFKAAILSNASGIILAHFLC